MLFVTKLVQFIWSYILPRINYFALLLNGNLSVSARPLKLEQRSCGETYFASRTADSRLCTRRSGQGADPIEKESVIAGKHSQFCWATL